MQRSLILGIYLYAPEIMTAAAHPHSARQAPALSLITILTMSQILILTNISAMWQVSPR